MTSTRRSIRPNSAAIPVNDFRKFQDLCRRLDENDISHCLQNDSSNIPSGTCRPLGTNHFAKGSAVLNATSWPQTAIGGGLEGRPATCETAESGLRLRAMRTGYWSPARDLQQQRQHRKTRYSTVRPQLQLTCIQSVACAGRGLPLPSKSVCPRELY